MNDIDTPNDIDTLDIDTLDKKMGSVYTINSKNEGSIYTVKKIKTYILKCLTNEYYCGKTNDIEKRMKEHKKEKKGWFAIPKRKEFEIIMIIKGDFEKSIKAMGSKNFVNANSNIERGCQCHEI